MVHRLWFMANLFIEVDDLGLPLGPCFEGAFGCVLQLNDPSGGKYALKMPRMLADTAAENAYIEDMFEEEVRRTLASGATGLNGLIPPNQLAQGNALRGLRQLGATNDDDAAAQNGSVVLLRLEKGTKPRFALAVSSDVSKVFPPGAREHFKPVIEADNWKKLQDITKDRLLTFAKTGVVSVSHSGEVTVTHQKQHLGGDRDIAFYFSSPPSLIFPWAENGTLQEAISSGQTAAWSVAQCYTLIQRVLTGLWQLHRQSSLKTVHGDVRPANVLSLGDPRLTNGAANHDEASQYVLADYGSLTNVDAVGPSPGGSGNTIVGPPVNPERRTPFYAPERRAAAEFENADTAVIVELGERPIDKIAVVVGFYRKMPNSEFAKDNAFKREIAELFESNSPDMRPPIDLRPGDRLRVRDYVFHIDTACRWNNCTVFLCRRNFGRISHERIVLYVIGDRPETVVSISRYNIYQKWSAATDLYSVGSLALYLLTMKSAPGREGESESKFAEILEVLEGIPYVETLWGDVHRFVVGLEDAIEKYGYNPDKIREFDVEKKSLLQAADAAAGSLIKTAPYMKEIAAVFDYNLAHFLLFVHFVLSSLHRQTTLRNWKATDRSMPPFSKDRADACEVSGVGVALERLTRIKTLLAMPDQRSLDLFKKPQDKLPTYDPRSDTVIRLERERLAESEALLRAGLEKTNRETGSLVQEMNKAVDTLDDVKVGMMRKRPQEVLDAQAILRQAIEQLKK